MMPEKRRYNVTKILVNTIWVILGGGTVALLLAAINKKDSSHCKAVEISIHGVKNNLFLDKSDVILMLEKMNFGALKGKPLNTFDLSGMEAVLEKNAWVKSVKIYFDNNDILKISIAEREPVARIFLSDGNSFYIDTAISRLPLSGKFSARLPVFTNFPVISGKLLRADSNLLRDIRNISLYLTQEPFWMAQIEQIDITPERSFEMIPKVGNQVIIFGSADNYEEKFTNLLTYYRNVLSRVGWNKYSRINVAYKGQVIAVKRGAGEIKADSLKTVQLMKQLVARAQKLANDSANNIQLAQPKEETAVPFSQARDEVFFDDEPLSYPGFGQRNTDPVTVKPAPVYAKPLLPDTGTQSIATGHSSKEKTGLNVKKNLPVKTTPAKPNVTKPVNGIKRQPKAVMPPANDY